jgi:hypothetical protein
MSGSRSTTTERTNKTQLSLNKTKMVVALSVFEVSLTESQAWLHDMQLFRATATLLNAFGECSPNIELNDLEDKKIRSRCRAAWKGSAFSQAKADAAIAKRRNAFGARSQDRYYRERRKKRPVSRKQNGVQLHTHGTNQGYATQNEAKPKTAATRKLLQMQA